MKRSDVIALLPIVLVLSACAASAPQTPYPAFIQVDDLPIVFIAGLPGVSAALAAQAESTMQKYGVAVTTVNHRYDDRCSVLYESDLRDEACIEHLANRLPLVAGLLP